MDGLLGSISAQQSGCLQGLHLGSLAGARRRAGVRSPLLTHRAPQLAFRHNVLHSGTAARRPVILATDCYPCGEPLISTWTLGSWHGGRYCAARLAPPAALQPSCIPVLFATGFVL